MAVGVPGALWWLEAGVRGRGVAPNASNAPVALAGLLVAMGTSRRERGRA